MPMSTVVKAWMQLNRDAHRVCKDAADRLVAYEPSDAFVHICGAFLRKGAETFSVVNVLYANHLEEPAQSLIRILFELRINFDCFLNIAQSDAKNAVQRVADSMMLEKIKQARASGFIGIPNEIKELLEQNEKQIVSRYHENDLSRMRKHGFTGVPIEQRAVKGRLNPATMGAFKTSQFERRKICYRCSPIPTMTGFKESRHGKSTRNGYSKRNTDPKTAWLVSTAYRPRAWNRP